MTAPYVTPPELTQGINDTKGLIGQQWASNIASGNGCANKELKTLLESQQSSTQVWTQGLLTALGAYKQYEMYKQQGDLYTAQQAYVDKQRELIEGQYNDLSKPQYLKAQAFLWDYSVPYAKSIMETVVKCGTKICEYTKDDVYKRAVLKVGPSIARAKRKTYSQFGVGQTGLALENNYRFVELEARLLTKAIAISDRYEDNRKMTWEDFYWKKMTGSAQIANNIWATGSNLFNGGTNMIQSVVSQMSNSSAAGMAAASGMASSLGHQGDLWGGLGTVAGRWAGGNAGQQAGLGLRSVAGMGNSGNGAMASTFGPVNVPAMGDINNDAGMTFGSANDTAMA